MAAVREYKLDSETSARLAQLESVTESVMRNIANGITSPAILEALTIVNQARTLLKDTSFKDKFDDLVELLQKIQECSVALSKTKTREENALAIDFMDIAIQMLTLHNKDQKELISKYRTYAIEFILARMTLLGIQPFIWTSMSLQQKMAEAMDWLAPFINTRQFYLILHLIGAQLQKPDLTPTDIVFDAIYQCAIACQEKRVMKALLLYSNKVVEAHILNNAGGAVKFVLECNNELESSLKSAAYTLKLNPKTRSLPFFQEFSIGDIKGIGIPKDLKKNIAVFAADPDLLAADEVFLLKKISEVNMSEPVLKPNDTPESVKNAIQAMTRFVTKKKGEPAAASIVKMFNREISQTHSHIDRAVTLAILDFRLEYGRGRRGVFNSILPKEVKTLQALLKSILSDMFGENEIDPTTAFLVRNYLSKLGQNKEYPEKANLKKGLDIYLRDFDSKIKNICERAVAIFSDKNKVQLLDKAVHNMRLKFAAIFASHEYFEKLTDSKVIDRCIFHFAELLCKRFIAAKTELARNKFVATSEIPIDPHSERNNPELHMTKLIKDSEILDVIRKAVSTDCTIFP